MDCRVQHSPHHVLANDVVVDRGQRIARAKEAAEGGPETCARAGHGLAAANQVDEAIVQQREHRGELRDDRVVVIAGVGDERLRQRLTLSDDAAIDPRDVLGLGPRDVAERAAGGTRRLLPAHPPQPELGAAVVIWRVERVEMGRGNRTAAVEVFQHERCAACVARARAQSSGNRKRNGGVYEIMRDELQQIGVARGDRRIFPAVQRRVGMRRPSDLRIHPPRQAMHQSADILNMSRRLQRVDAECAEALRGAGCAEEVAKTGRRTVPSVAAAWRVLESRRKNSIGTACRHHSSLAPIGQRACWVGREIIVILYGIFTGF